MGHRVPQGGLARELHAGMDGPALVRVAGGRENVDTGTCTELFVDSGYMDKLNRAGAPHEVSALFELVLNHVVFQRPLERPFVFGEQESMELWHWLGSCCVPAAQRPPPQ